MEFGHAPVPPRKWNPETGRWEDQHVSASTPAVGLLSLATILAVGAMVSAATAHHWWLLVIEVAVAMVLVAAGGAVVSWRRRRARRTDADDVPPR